ncbi:MAG: shikimate kinase [Pseudohongiellaceae bacterium]
MLGLHENLILVGLRGSGKTTLGGDLAASLQRPFVDLDDRLASLAGESADDVLAHQGEPAFRNIERAVLLQAAQLRGAVIATGGGAVLHRREMAGLAATGCVVFLDVPLALLLERARARPRPRLCGGSIEDEFVALSEERRSSYDELAQITLSSPDVRSILGELNGWPFRSHG